MKHLLYKAFKLLWVVVCIFVCTNLLFIFIAKGDINKLPDFFGYKPLTVLSNSMLPDIEAGDVVIIDTNKEPELGDIATYVSNEKTLVTHRVIEVVEQEGVVTYKTKGDFNNHPDESYTTKESIVGVRTFTIPKLGYIASFFAKPLGIVLLIVLPLVSVVLIELFQRIGLLPNSRKTID